LVHHARHRPGARAWWFRPRALAAGLVAGAGLATAIWLPGRNDVASATERTTVFGDDFGGDRGTPADDSLWRVDDRGAAAVQDGSGNLVLTKLMTTKRLVPQRYGHAEARIEVARERGPWRAFGIVFTPGLIAPGKVRVLDENADPTGGDAFHTYAIDWSPTAVVWSVDGKPSLELELAVPGRPLALVLDFAADGFGPARMLVDYVHVTTGREATPPTGTPASPSPAAPSPAAPSPAPATQQPSAQPSTAAPAAEWKAFTKYAVGQLVSFKGVIYKVNEAHTSLPGWEPTNVPALFTKV
jgi:hypothetical protein